MPKPARLGSLPAVVALLAVVALAACGTSEPSSPVAPAPATPPPTAEVTAGSSASPSPDATDTPATPVPSEDPVVTEPPSEPATESAPPESSTSPEPAETPTIAPGAADACTVSNDANREFFVRVADAVDWPVLCAVLPARWVLLNGTYHLAHGGEMAVDYGGPGGATLNLQEGAFCSDSDGCVPAGTDVGDAALGALAGTLVELDAGGFAIVIDRGASPSWLMVVNGVDQATAVSIGAAMAQVAS